MLISPEEVKLFFALYPSLIGFAAGQSGGIEGIRDAGTFKSAPNKAKAQARNHLLNNIQLIKNYTEENPDGFRERELGYMPTLFATRYYMSMRKRARLPVSQWSILPIGAETISSLMRGKDYCPDPGCCLLRLTMT